MMMIFNKKMIYKFVKVLISAIRLHKELKEIDERSSYLLGVTASEAYFKLRDVLLKELSFNHDWSYNCLLHFVRVGRESLLRSRLEVNLTHSSKHPIALLENFKVHTINEEVCSLLEYFSLRYMRRCRIFEYHI